eukprot:tig00021489_g21673.t1
MLRRRAPALAAAILLVVATAALAAPNKVEDGVVVLADEGFDEYVGSIQQRVALVEFYAPWCKHCKKFAPEYAEAARLLRERAAVLKVDGTKNDALATRFEIRSFPTIFAISDGGRTVQKYEGDLSTEALVRYVDALLSPDVEEVFRAEDIEERGREHPAIAVGFLLRGRARAAFDSVSAEMKSEVKFLSVDDAEIARRFNVSGPYLAMLRRFDEPVVSIPAGKMNATEIKHWVQTYDVRLLDVIDSGNSRKYVGRGRPVGYLFLDPSSEAASRAASRAVRRVALKYRGLAYFVIAERSLFDKMYAGSEAAGAPGARFGVEAPGGLHFLLDPARDAASEEDVDGFVAAVLRGRAEPYVRSQPAPTDDDRRAAAPVQILVGRTLLQEVRESQRDLFVLFHDPRCGACQAYGPVWREVARALQDLRSVTVAQIDATANDYPGFKVSSYPTLYFVGADGGRRVRFEGDRSSAAELLAFVAEHSSFEVRMPDAGQLQKRIAHVEETLERERREAAAPASPSGSGAAALGRGGGGAERPAGAEAAAPAAPEASPMPAAPAAPDRSEL